MDPFDMIKDKLIFYQSLYGEASVEYKLLNTLRLEVQAQRERFDQAGYQIVPKELVEAARDFLQIYIEGEFMRTADMHRPECDCIRCRADKLEHLLKAAQEEE